MTRAFVLPSLLALGVSLASGGLALAAEPPLKALQAACAEDAPASARVPGYAVTRHAADPGDLPYAEARSTRTGATVRIYHDPDLGEATAPKAACLGALIDMAADMAADTRKDLHWSAVTATRQADYIPPRDKAEARWLNPMVAGRWDDAAVKFLVLVMPHEETHFSQARPGAPHLPRWFQEGHAEWAGLHVTEQVRPDLVQQRRQEVADALKAKGVVHLGQWGGMKVKPEALERQLSPEDRAKRAADPNYRPKGPFRFNPDDFTQDSDNGEANYGAALAVFDGLEARHGRAAVQAWASAVLASPDSKRIVELAQEKLGEDIAPLLL